MYASAIAESDCPSCRGTHMFLYGDKWKCADCGFAINDDQLQSENAVLWFCDSCETFLNVQDGFTDKNGKWKCKCCGHENDVSKNNVF